MPPSSGSSKVFILKPGHLCEFRFECFPFYAEMMASPLQTHLFPSSESRLQPFLPRILSETRLGHRALLCKARSLKTDILFMGLHSRQEFLSFHEEELEVVQQLILVEAFTSWNKKKEVSWEICHCTFPDSVQSVAQSCLTLCDPVNRSTPGLPVHHQLPEFTQTHVHRVSDAIQPSHPLASPSPPAPNPSQHQSLFQ